MLAEDSALSLMLGLVCESCDAYNDPGVSVCASCGKPLAAVDNTGQTPQPLPSLPEPPPAAVSPPSPQPPPVVAAPPPWMQAPTGKPLATQFAQPKVDLASVAQAGKGLVAPVELKALPCGKCGTALQPGDRFCRNCGTPVGAAPLNTTQIATGALPPPGGPAGGTQVMPALGGGARPAPAATMMFGAVVAERAAKVVLVRGQSEHGSQWRLGAAETVIGRDEGTIRFPDDRAIAARHCRLVQKGADVWLEPEATTNGVFLRVREPVRVGPGDEIVLGAQRLRVLADADRPTHGATPQGDTRLLGSMLRAGPAIALLRVASEPAQNEVYYRTQRLLTLGRNNCDVNFPRDGFVSERHAQIAQGEGGALILEDLRSRNGTYLRARQATKLAHGDLLLLGDKVLRLELPRT